MNILGVSDSHEAHACVVRDGHLVAAMSEERLSRLKADMGYPRRAIDAVLRIADVSPEEIDVVAFAGQQGTPLQRLYKMNALFGVKDWIRQCHEYWGPVLLEGKPLTAWDDFALFRGIRGESILDDPYYSFVERALGADPSTYGQIFHAVRLDALEAHLGITGEKVRSYRHEECHKAYGLMSAPVRPKKAVVLTVEGGGDDSSATMSVADGLDIKEHWASNSPNLGRLYRYVTLILGMVPAQHEYKVMGLAPYGTAHHGRHAKAFFDTLSKVEGLEILNTGIVKDLYYSVRDALEGERFDGIAWGLQRHTEDILQVWVQNIIDETGLPDVILSGGVGQNIKACKHLADSTSLTSLWAGPICGDGSLGIGAAWLASRDLAPDVDVHGFESIYLGTSYDEAAVWEAVHRNSLADSFTLVERPTSEQVANWLDAGLVCSRYSGAMEFGQRALGNRSILADPRRWTSVEKINDKIKYRDFWMPFTPTILNEEADRLLENPKNLFSPYMTIAFDIVPEFREVLPAVIHPADKTVRPQMLQRDANPAYHDIIERFRERTGVPAVLNTSFNLHGEPIVESPEDAISTFLRSDIDVLLFDHVAITRKGS